MRSTIRLAFAGLSLLNLIGCKKDEPGEKLVGYTTVSTLAGNGTYGLTNSTGTAAQFCFPEGAAVDSQGNLYVADAGNACIRKVTPAGVVTNFTGAGLGFVNGPLATAKFSTIEDVAFDNQGNLYVADAGNNCIRKITTAGMVSTLAGSGTAGFADGPGATAQFDSPNSIAIDAQGLIYVSDYDNARIRKIAPNGIVSTLAGTGQLGFVDGAGNVAQFIRPTGLAVTAQGLVYVADFAGHRIRAITSAGVVSTLAGDGVRGSSDGTGASARFSAPYDVTIDSQGDIYVADMFNHCIRKVTAGGTVTTLAGTKVKGVVNGPVGTAQFDLPAGIVAGANGTLYVMEDADVRKITAQ